MTTTPGAGANVSYGLIYRGNLIPLGQVPTVIGRSTGCKIMLDDSEVSRRHARLVVRDGDLWLDDLASANGAFINEERVDGSSKLRADDTIRIGSQEFRVSRMTERPRKAKRKRFRTPYGQDQVRRASLDRLWDDEESSHQQVESTRRTTQLELMARAADQLFERKRSSDAATLLEPVLLKLLAGAKKGSMPAANEFDTAVCYAVRLASATRKGRWVEYVFALGAAVGRPLSAEQLDDVTMVLDRAEQVAAEPVANYLATLEDAGAVDGDNGRELIAGLREIQGKLSGKG